MTVFIDDARNVYGRMKMAHMITDGPIEELHEMAKRMGLKRKWFQPLSFPHYDISLTRRKMAIEFGAKQVTQHELIIIIRKLRSNETA